MLIKLLLLLLLLLRSCSEGFLSASFGIDEVDGESVLDGADVDDGVDALLLLVYGQNRSDKCFFRIRSGPGAKPSAKTFSSSKIVIDSAALPIRRSRAWTGSSSSSSSSMAPSVKLNFLFFIS